MDYKKEVKMKNKISELKATIDFLCREIENAKALIEDDPALAKLLLNEIVNDHRYTFK